MMERGEDLGGFTADTTTTTIVMLVVVVIAHHPGIWTHLLQLFLGRGPEGIDNRF